MYSSTLFFNLGARYGWVVDTSPRPLDSRGRPGIRCIGGWLDPTTGLDGCGKSRPHQDSIPGPSRTWRLAIQTTLSWPTLLRSTAGNLYEFTAFIMIQKRMSFKVTAFMDWGTCCVRKWNTTVWEPECSRPAWTSGWEHPDWFGASPPYHLRTDKNPVLETSCSLVTARRSIKPRKQVTTDCNTSVSEPCGIHAANVHVTS